MTFELVVPFMKTGIPEPLRELCVLNIRLQKSKKSTLWQFLTLLILNNFYFSLLYIGQSATIKTNFLIN